MNKRILDRYRKILNNTVEKSDMFYVKDLFNKSDFETQILFSKLVRYDYLNYNFLNEEQAFMMTYFSYLMCKRDMEEVMKDIAEYITGNEEYSDIKEMDIWNIKKGIEQYRYYPDNYTFKQNLLNMIFENKIKFLQTYKKEEIQNLKKFI